MNKTQSPITQVKFYLEGKYVGMQWLVAGESLEKQQSLMEYAEESGLLEEIENHLNPIVVNLYREAA